MDNRRYRSDAFGNRRRREKPESGFRSEVNPCQDDPGSQISASGAGEQRRPPPVVPFAVCSTRERLGCALCKRSDNTRLPQAACCHSGPAGNGLDPRTPRRATHPTGWQWGRSHTATNVLDVPSTCATRKALAPACHARAARYPRPPSACAAGPRAPAWPAPDLVGGPAAQASSRSRSAEVANVVCLWALGGREGLSCRAMCRGRGTLRVRPGCMLAFRAGLWACGVMP